MANREPVQHARRARVSPYRDEGTIDQEIETNDQDKKRTIKGKERGDERERESQADTRVESSRRRDMQELIDWATALDRPCCT